MFVNLIKVDKDKGVLIEWQGNENESGKADTFSMQTHDPAHSQF